MITARRPKTRRLTAAVAFLPLLALGCWHDDDSDSPTDPAGNGFIELTTVGGATTLPADGLSVLGLRARIDPRGVKAGRSIRFRTSEGSLSAPGNESGAKEVSVAPDSSGTAAALLKSSTTVGPVTVSAAVVDQEDGMSTVVVSTQRSLEFTDPGAGDVIRFVEAPAEGPADGRTPLRFSVEVAPSVPTTAVVTFRTTVGSFTPGMDDREEEAAIDDRNRATVLLYSDDEITEGTISATVQGHRTEVGISFERAAAEEILVEVDPFRLEPDGTTTVTVTLVRDVGTPTAGAVVTFDGEDATGAPFGTSRNVTRSDAAGEASAVLHREGGGTDGTGRVIVTAEDSSAVGTAEVELVPEPPDDPGE